MSWNDGSQRKQFERKQKKQAEEFRKHGMTEDQINKIHIFNLKAYRADRIYAMHTQSLDEMESEGDETRNTLHKKVQESMTCSLELSECGHLGWIEEIENFALYCAVSKLSEAQKELLTLIYHDGYTQTEVAEIYHTTISAINKRMKRITKRLFKLVVDEGGIG